MSESLSADPAGCSHPCIERMELLSLPFGMVKALSALEALFPHGSKTETKQLHTLVWLLLTCQAGHWLECLSGLSYVLDATDQMCNHGQEHLGLQSLAGLSR